MAIRASKLMSDRLKGMLVRDKTGLGQGFKAAMSADIARTLSDYFCLSGGVEIDVEPLDNGNFSVTITSTAKKILRFDSTADFKD